MELYNYQQIAVDKAVEYFKASNEHPFNIFFDMGLGKTLTAISIANELKPASLLILCPKSLCGMWEYNISKYYKHRYVLQTNIQKFGQGFDETCICITNYEKVFSLQSAATPDICILDEVHILKNYKSEIHKTVFSKVIPDIAVALTGTPITRNLMDLFGVLNCVKSKSNITPTQFKYKYINNGGLTSTTKLLRDIADYTVMANLEDYIEMPGYGDITVSVDATQEQYNIMRDMLYNWNDNILQKLTELQQFTSAIKRNAVDALIRELLAEGKVVIFCKYNDEYNYLMEKYACKAVGINGKVKDRDEQVWQFQNNPNIQVFVGNLQTAGLGLTLTAASNCIIYSETFNWGDAQQARRRIYRIGQDKYCTYYHILVRDSIDEFIYRNNKDKTQLVSEFKRLYGGTKNVKEC